MTQLLSGAELTALRAVVLGLMPDTCSILRAGTVIDAYGNHTETWATAATAVACRLDPLSRSPGELLVAAQEQARTYWQATLDYGADVERGDRLRINAVDYEIIQLHERHSARIVTRATLARLE